MKFKIIQNYEEAFLTELEEATNEGWRPVYQTFNAREGKVRNKGGMQLLTRCRILVVMGEPGIQQGSPFQTPIPMSCSVHLKKKDGRVMVMCQHDRAHPCTDHTPPKIRAKPQWKEHKCCEEKCCE